MLFIFKWRRKKIPHRHYKPKHTWTEWHFVYALLKCCLLHKFTAYFLRVWYKCAMYMFLIKKLQVKVVSKMLTMENFGDHWMSKIHCIQTHGQRRKGCRQRLIFYSNESEINESTRKIMTTNARPCHAMPCCAKPSKVPVWYFKVATIFIAHNYTHNVCYFAYLLRQIISSKGNLPASSMRRI